MNIPSYFTYETILLELNNDSKLKSNPIHYYPDSNKTAVILDPRFNPLMEAVIRNFMYFMNPREWNLCIVSYSGYRKVIKSIFPNCIFMAIDEKYIYMKDNIPNIKIESYNEIFLNKYFWKSLPGEHILIFQTDCIMFNMFPDYYLLYDYCGANYYTQNALLYGGINGGCSLRKKSVMIECIEKINWNTHVPEYKSGILNIYKKYNNYDIHKKYNIYGLHLLHRTFNNEDIFFTYACEILMKCVPDKIHRTFFAIEVDQNSNTCIYHGWNKNYHTNSFAIEMLKSSPLFNKYITEIENMNPTQNISAKSEPLLENICNVAD
jgi:hypothetical protein